MSDNDIIQKIAITFAKKGAAKYYSHHDLMRFFERILRRAGLSLRMTSGFNPRPRMVFPHALGLGIDSECEVLEVELTSSIGTEAILANLRNVVGEVLDIVKVEDLPPVKKSMVVKSCGYLVSGWRSAEEASRVIAELAEAEKILVERGFREKCREIDAKQYVLDAKSENCLVLIELLHTAKGAGRIDELLRWMEMRAGIRPFGLHAVKTHMEPA